MILPRPRTDLPELGEVAQALTRLGERLEASPADSLVDAVVRCAVEWVDGARWASVTVLQQGSFRTLGHTGPEAAAADALQYDLRSGPCVDAVLDESVLVSGNLAHDDRWPGYGPRVVREVGVTSVLSHRLRLIGDPELIASLNLYSDAPDAFDEHAVWAGTLLATHAGLGISVAVTHRRAAHLETALRTNREIGTAIGILMARHRVTREQAQELLRLASQDTNRKMSEIAAEVVRTGELSLPRRPPSGSA
ncbi:GAF and ANTAR domain-containing protein [Kocuria sp. SM24M-10]|uniref:GAF and ANTAR domain-containing protein n=1 Tax=Kocuria sp. SM24M-10 TaxID=1660349 RepID=UPI0006495221|nr:GAF and ANTAR domain-containing protein [Kocuria sp. SM24M-10]KLU09298.1 hypothetical protein ABL57_13245 [Kocuria sp. SM24M-10]